MTSVHASLTAFIAAAALLTIMPGLDMAYVLKTNAAAGARQAALAALGIAFGCFCWAALVAFGLGAVLAASQLAYTVLRWVGAAYLIYTGYGMLRHPRHRFPDQASRADSTRAFFATGALTNLLNPKVGVFYVSFLPQFVPGGVSVAPYIVLLGAIHAFLGLIWFATLLAATRPIMAILRKPLVLRSCDRLTGSAFIAFGVGLALQSRRT